ncbi:MAG: adenosine deaminase family protein [Candidatus Marinimicrobia bacterium]|nr:adenosine deaminase family protein [Candidatus Neomarinimicrobiota bacterium]
MSQSRRTVFPVEFIRAIPKTDLHLHLDGSLRIATLLELAQAEGLELPGASEAELRRAVFKDSYADLPEYLQGFAYTCAVMRRAEHLERIAYELAQDNLAENVCYCEVRFAPQLHIHETLSLAEIVRAVCRGLERAKQEHNQGAAVRAGAALPFDFGVIVCAMRSFHRDMSLYYRRLFEVMQYARPQEVYATASLELARAAVALAHEEGLPVVGFDLAGEEAGFPAVHHRDAYQYVHRHFLRKTVHAGEAYGPESIFQAITECQANRIGHGTFLFAADRVSDALIPDPERYVSYLAEYIASQRIAIEVCPTSNLQTIPGLGNVGNHPLRQMIEHNLSVCICTDNRLVSNTTVTEELWKVTDALPLTPSQFQNLVLAGFKGSFFPGSYLEKRRYVRAVLDRYGALEQQYHVRS